jgi:hypothetical protein
VPSHVDRSNLARRWPLALLAPLALALMLGCGGKRGDTLYVFDGASRTVLAWDNLDQIHQAAREHKPLPPADRQIKSSQFDDLNLAWGGLVVDSVTDRLYLVSTQGTVYAIARASAQKGPKPLRKADLTWFRLGSGKERGESGRGFGPASLESGHNLLYVVEQDRDGQTPRIWHVPQLSKIRPGSSLAPEGHGIRGKDGTDRSAVGVTAVPGGRFFALFGDGDAVDPGDGSSVRGPRLRQGRNGELPVNSRDQPVQFLTGPGTRLKDRFAYGSLGFDAHRHELYVLAGNASSAEAPRQILVFGESQFHGSYEQAPQRTMSGVPDALRILALAPDGNWMVGAAFSPETRDSDSRRSRSAGQGTGQSGLTLWADPHLGKPPIALPDLPGAREIRGLAID